MRIGRRDEEFRAFYAAEADRLHRLAVLLTGEPERASDLAQEALLRSYRAWPRIQREDPAPYVRRVLVNLVRNEARRKLIERRHPPGPAAFHEDHGPRTDDAIRVAEVLRTLPPVRRAVVVLRFYEDLPEAEIARILDRPLGTIKSDLHRALKTLRPLLQDGLKEAT